MRNIFSSMDFSYMQSDPHGITPLAYIENSLFKLVPLELMQLDLPYTCTLDEWRIAFKNAATEESPDQLARTALELGCYYRDFIGNNAAHYKYEPLVQDNHHEENIAKIQRLLSEDELLTNLLLSYYYYSSNIKTHSTDCFESHALDKFCKGKYDKTIDRLTKQKDAYRDQNPFFTYSFLRWTTTIKGTHPFYIDNPYDTGFILSMLISLRKSLNPFVLNKEDYGKNRKINLQSMKEYYKAIPLTSSDNDVITDLLKNHARRHYNHNYASIYNQFLLERLSAMNFFAELNDQKLPIGSPLYYTLNRYILCPLLNFRIDVLKFNKELIKNNLEVAYDIEWCHTLTRILYQIINCTIPIYEMIFYYLMELRYNSKNFSNKSALMESDMRNCLTPIKSTSITPFYKKNATGIYLGKSQANLSELAIPYDMYIRFFQATNYYSFDQIFSNQFNIHTQKFNALSLCNALTTKSFYKNDIIKKGTSSSLYRKKDAP